MFRRIVFSAVAAGLLAGILLTAVQRLQVVPVILEAETYEVADPGTTTPDDTCACRRQQPRA